MENCVDVKIQILDEGCAGARGEERGAERPDKW